MATLLVEVRRTPYRDDGDCRLLGLLTEAGALRGPAPHQDVTAAGR